MRTWTDLIPQVKVYSTDFGYGIATAKSNDGLLFVHYDSDPWFPHQESLAEVEVVG